MQNHHSSHKKLWLAGSVPILGLALLGWALLDRPQAATLQLTSQGQNVHPHLAVDAKGNIYATWIQIKDEKTSVLFSKSTDHGRSFQSPVVVSPPEMDMDTGADGGSQIAVGKGGQIYLVWGGTMSPEPTMRPSGFEVPGGKHINNTRAALDMFFSRSLDGGKTFSAPKTVNDDAKVEEGDSPDKQFRHRLPSMALGPHDEIYVTWIDKRNGTSLDPNVTKIYLTKSSDGGNTFEPNVDASSLQQESTCVCCRPSVSADSKGSVMVTFRNSIDEIKDMYSAFSQDGGKTFKEMMPVDHGGWQFFGCPMSGPSTATRSDELDVAWGDGAAHGTPGHDMDIGLTVYYAHKGSGDTKFSRRETVSQNGNHPAIVATASGKLYAVWEEYSKQGADIYLAELGGGSARQRRRISSSDSGYYPALAASPDGSELYVAWKDIRGDKPQVYFAAVPVEESSFKELFSAALFWRRAN
jgi:hypothetical protein